MPGGARDRRAETGSYGHRAVHDAAPELQSLDQGSQDKLQWPKFTAATAKFADKVVHARRLH